MGDWLQDRCNSIQKAQQEHIQKSLGTDDIEKARAGIYKPTKQNLKEGKVGQKYGEEKKEKEDDGVDFDKFDKIEIQALAGRDYRIAAGFVRISDKSVKSIKDAKNKMNEELKQGREHNFSYNKVKVIVRGWKMGQGYTDLGEFKRGINK